ncbi:choice-of-anchor D domain-containing protein [bacterium]|nr:choice-of-anchor D domain-containing protein [bacterium]
MKNLVLVLVCLALFTIAASAQEIEVITPGQGDQWVIGEVDGALIEWTHADITGTVFIHLYDRNDFIMSIAEGVDIEDGTYIWTVPEEVPEGNNRYNVYIESDENADVNDESRNFDIVAGGGEPGELEVVSPGQGDTWIVEEVDGAVVEWNATNVEGTILIHLYEHNSFYMSIDEAVDADAATYTWTVPQEVEAGNGYRIYIESNDDAEVNDLGSNFTIEGGGGDGELEVVSPGQGDTWIIGEENTVEWNALNLEVTTILIHLYDNQNYYMTITDEVDADAGTFTWTVPEEVEASNNYRIYIESNVNQDINDLGSGFDIEAPGGDGELEVVSPGQGDTWIIGEENVVEWTALNLEGTTILIHLYDNQNYYMTITDEVEADAGTFAWTVPEEVEASNNYRIYIESSINPDINDLGSGFDIEAPFGDGELEVVSPGQGDTWIIGEENVVEWTALNLEGTTILIHLYDNQNYSMTITDEVDADVGTFTWTVPDEVEAGNNYRIYIESNVNPDINDLGSGFDIEAPGGDGEIEIVSPGQGDTWIIEDVDGAVIEWTSLNLDGTTVLIHLYEHNSFYMTIAEEVNIDDGTYTWTVPQGVEPGNNAYRVYIESSINPDVNDLSSNFSIEAPGGDAELEVTAPAQGDTWIIGEENNIEWSALNMEETTVLIHLYEHNSFYMEIATEVDADAGTYAWTVPPEVAEGNNAYRVYIESNINPDVNDRSGSFSIEAPEQDEPAIVISPEEMEFGDVEIFETEMEDVTISNVGNLDLTILSAVVTGDGFSAAALENIVIPPGESETVTISFTPTSDIEYAGLLTVTSDDPQDDVIEVRLAGAGVLPLVPTYSSVGITALINTEMDEIYIDNGNLAALDPDATDGYNSGIDLPKPSPPPDSYLTVYFPHPEWQNAPVENFMVDVRNANDDLTIFVKVFSFVVDSDLEGETVNLTFTIGDEYPDEYEVALFDPLTQQLQDLRQNNAYSFVMGEDARELDLRLGNSTPPEINILFPYADALLDIESEYEVLWELDDEEAIEYQLLHYSLDGGNTWTQIDSIVGGATSYLWTTPDVFTTYAKMKLFAHDLAGENMEFETAYTFNIATHHVQQEFSAPWNMVSVPIIPDDPARQAIFGDDVSILYSYDQNGGYTIEDEMDHGAGYWLFSEDDVNAVVDGTPEVNQTIHPLPTGWTIVGSTLPVGTSVENLRFTDGVDEFMFTEAVDAGWILPSFYGYNNNTFSYDLTTDMNPWDGYWLNVLVDDLDMISEPPELEDLGLATGGELDEDTWYIPIHLTIGELTDHLVGIGINEEASSEFDVWYDIPTPPASPGDFILGSFDHNEWDAPARFFSQDRRSLMEPGDTFRWELNIASSTEGEVILEFDGIQELLPVDHTAIAQIGEEVYNLLETPVLTFDYVEPVEVTIYVTWQETGVLNEFTTGIPSDYSISTIYPNPFNPSTVAVVGLPETANLTVTVLNVLGQRIATLADGGYSLGYHSFVFDAKGQSSGIYFIHAYVPGKLNALQKVMLVR